MSHDTLDSNISPMELQNRTDFITDLSAKIYLDSLSIEIRRHRLDPYAQPLEKLGPQLAAGAVQAAVWLAKALEDAGFSLNP